MGFKESFTKGAITALTNVLISTMPKKLFTSQANSNKFMLAGNEKFTQNAGEKWTCGFGKAKYTPDLGDGNIYYIAGYDSNNPAKSILDDLYARAVYLDDNRGDGGVIFCALDCVGISRHDINDIKMLALESGKLGKMKSINISATHTHAGIDTQGLWGEKIYKCGKNDKFMANLKRQAAKAIVEAYESRKDGKLYMGYTETVDMQADVRTPVTYDKNLTRLRFAPDDKSGDIYVVNFASHAELLGTTTKVSADFPAYLIKEIEENVPKSNAVFFNGAIGGMISAKEIKKVYRNEIDCEEYMKGFGKELGKIALSIEEEKELKPIVNIKSKGIRVVADNTVLILARYLKVLNNDIGRTEKRNKACIYSEVGYAELGDKDVAMFLIPGELFPELYTGEFLPPEEAGTHRKSSYKKVLSEMTDCKHKFVIGLCNDELGYILAENDFVLHESLPYINNGKDDMDRGHYEETNSTGPNTAGTILNAVEELIGSAK